MTPAQIKDAIEQMKVHCDLAMEDNYRGLSARSVLRELGYHEDDLKAVLQTLYDGGFTYCLDYTFATKDGEFPSQDVCIWGPDQLKSRLHSIYIPIT